MVVSKVWFPSSSRQGFVNVCDFQRIFMEQLPRHRAACLLAGIPDFKVEPSGVSTMNVWTVIVSLP
jgi:hypothetical protein